MTPKDFRALTPLIYSHVNPYGNFDLDMAQRIPIYTYDSVVTEHLIKAAVYEIQKDTVSALANAPAEIAPVAPIAPIAPTPAN